MSNTQDPGSGKPSEEESEADVWKASLLRRTDELGHVQAQTAPVADRRNDPPSPSEFAAPGGIHAPPMRGVDVPGAVKAPPGATPASPRKAVPEPPPPPPARPLAAVLALGSGACALLAAVLLVLPEFRHLGTSSDEVLAAQGAETTLAPRFDSSAPVAEGQVREQHDTLRGISVLMIESEPPGATVTVDGVKQGSTPLSLTPICNPGNPLRVKLVRKGFDSLEHVTVCREDTMTKLTARLRKARGSR
ncbi:PEGA domain-containing protein [Pyxidicoccus trucidator]|uniref:PEGA domain-containing protein n=1 Tax=Pyxidicoccus trucidator TaxID=2709662 RepID=UPI0013D9F0D1|nr:PEGA domain-containing protein [Pyxidicoccus trucidator]